MKMESRLFDGKIEALSKFDGQKVELPCGSFTAHDIMRILERSFGIDISRSKAYKGGNVALFADNVKPKWVENAFGVKLGEFDGDIVFHWWRNDIQLCAPVLRNDDWVNIFTKY